MTFAVRFPTRHTDTFAATGFVHAGVLLALTELAYSAFEQAVGLEKPAHVVAVERRTRAEYHQPLPWRDGLVVEVVTLAVAAAGFTQAFTLRSARTDRLVARIEHDWVWLNTATGRPVPLDETMQARMLATPPAATPVNGGPAPAIPPVESA